ncbi:hypothetical protein V8C42DRAFT_341487 [Trichoderma barbatum]
MAPYWILEKRLPVFVGEQWAPFFGGNKFLWGNIAAFDVLSLGLNEGNDYEKKLKLLFADIPNLPHYLERGSFSRIDVCNTFDSFFAGIHPTVALMEPLLQAPLIKPHATLITLFRNAVLENMTRQDKVLDMLTYSPTTKLVLKYLSLKEIPVNNYDRMADPMAIKWAYALANATVYDHMFDR